MNIPEIFRYNTLISIPLFSLVALLLIRKTRDFSFSHHTVSKSVLFLNHPTNELIFRLNFIIKAVLDLGFVWYLLQHFHLSINSPLAWFLIPSDLLFGSLAFFVEGKYTVMHAINGYGCGVLWAISQLYLSYLIGNPFFTQFTYIMTVVPLLLEFSFIFTKKTNALIQIGYMSLWYIWLLVFVFRYL